MERPRPSAADTPRIAILPVEVRNQIAAGEVIERPASVLKELVENALDAGARELRIDLEGGGLRLVRVQDDGEGMSPADLALAFVPHATSKLARVEDLEHIASLGFRGEALASIGSVARCRIVSRRAGAAQAWSIEDEGGRIGPCVEAGAGPGTTVEVRDLFYNTPARRRFLKREATELARCLDVVQRLALAHGEVGVVATHDGRRLFDVEAAMDLRGRIRRTFGAELAESLVEVEAQDRAGGLSLSGFVAPPRLARNDTSRQMWFVNGRPLKDRLLVRVAKEAYRGFLVEGRQPAAFLRLSLDPAEVDVNVHPTKSEVRFREERRVFGFCASALRDAVQRTDMATPGAAMLRGAAAPARALPHPAAGQRWFAEPERPRAAHEEAPAYEIPRRAHEHGHEPGREPGPRGERAWSERDPFGGPFLQIARTYILREVEDGLEIVDQHALHERVTFEALMAEVRAGRIEVQRLLVPELCELSRAEVQALAAQADLLARAGIELAAFGDTTIAVSGLPARLARPDVAGLVRDVVGILEAGGEAPSADALLEEVLHSAACRSSVMAGDRLSESEIRALLERGGALDSDQTCPHARPTRVRFTRADLEKAFHRR